ncbi:MAG TPA: hypothetical protein PKA76_19385 [Pirellulaceae bacterium]|nr:hypothetical protein [Pirellulaceae bacterium]
MLELVAGKYRVIIANDPTYAIGSADNVRSCDHIYHLDDARAEYAVTSRHTVTVTEDNKTIATCILLAGGGASGVHENSALIHQDNCIIAVGPFLASLILPTLELNWATQADDATCFGVHQSQYHECLISHGEMVISRVTFRGTIVWQADGAEIFTNECLLYGNVVRVTDFNDREYIFDINNGREIVA